MKRTTISLFATTMLFGALLISACSDSGSSTSNDPAEIESSASVDTVDSQPGAASVNIPLDSSGFADIQAVYQSIQPNEKAVFILRHGEREPRVTKESPLTEDGIEQSKSVGAKLAGQEEFNYLSTDFVRTKETCHNIAIGRGQESFPYDTNSLYTSATYKKDKEKFNEYNSLDGNNSNIVISMWAYTGEYADAFNDIAETSETIIASTFQNLQNRITVICSHDDFLVPLIAYTSNRKADLKIYETHKWLNYLAGVAIIVDGKGNRRSYAIKGLESGTR
jgi:phosphohistidine phosphatase SixA